MRKGYGRRQHECFLTIIERVVTVNELRIGRQSMCLKNDITKRKKTSVKFEQKGRKQTRIWTRKYPGLST
ncbi:unnamed protein product [Rhizophagus irregularis]|nr:unnamed protein product [Rhizophagus irregularis]